MIGRRIIGLETEYGCLIEAPLSATQVIPAIRNWFFDRNHLGLIDTHDREWDEPAGNGGFLFNGGRLYVDMGHLEYCTPECRSLVDAIRYDRVGDLLLNQAVEELGFGGQVSFIRNNIDHYTGATFGCHENFSLLRNAPYTEANILSLLAFQTLRVLYTGTGRVAGNQDNPFAFYGNESEAPDPAFQISQRADYIQNDFFQWVQHNRAIINTRDEPLADPRLYRRLHLLHGDTHVLPAALFLKLGTTALVLDLFEADALPLVMLADAVGTLRTLSRHPDGPWTVSCLATTDSPRREPALSTENALELLECYRLAASEQFAGRDAETDTVLGLWAHVNQGLSNNPKQLFGLLDWVTKRELLESFRTSESLAWDDPWLQAQDLEYHQTDPERSLGLACADRNGLWARGEEALEPARSQPPGTTRARSRSKLMNRIAADNLAYRVDWDHVDAPGHWTRTFSDPFNTRADTHPSEAPDPDAFD
ncbi:MAG: proteasome accessory factor PafA2 family protein [Opitutales bacterium]